MEEHRDSPEIEPGHPEKARANAGRRFAGMVGSHVGRKLALPRLAIAAALAVSLGGVLLYGGFRILGAIQGWVAARPEYRLRFSAINLVPPPDPWVLGGSSRILDEVRSEAGRGESISLLDLDLNALENDFRRCAWVKSVSKGERSYRQLSLQLTYRKPVAAVILTDRLEKIAYPIDEEAVALDPDDIDWTSRDRHPPFQVRGIAEPLIEILGVPSSSRPKFGVPWKRSSVDVSIEEDDPHVREAARLAEFLQRQGRSAAKDSLVPKFVSIYLPGDPDKTFFLIDSGRNVVNWGKPPGDQKAGDPSSEDRWKMLVDWVHRNGPLDAKSPNYLFFSRSGAELRKVSPPLRKKP